MNRRGFLGLAAAAAVAPKALVEPGVRIFEARAMAPAIGDGVPLFAAIHPARSGVMTAAAFRAQLAEGLNAVFNEAYANTPEGWQEMFEAPDAQLDDDALEVIEIWRLDEPA